MGVSGYTVRQDHLKRVHKLSQMEEQYAITMNPFQKNAFNYFRAITKIPLEQRKTLNLCKGVLQNSVENVLRKNYVQKN